jgi:hypothetical protein
MFVYLRTLHNGSVKCQIANQRCVFFLLIFCQNIGPAKAGPAGPLTTALSLVGEAVYIRPLQIRYIYIIFFIDCKVIPI